VLHELRIRSLGVIDDAVLRLGPGLNVVTGETGAGKTMVVQSLGLLLGGRADAALVRAGSTAAIVEGIVDAPPGEPVAIRVLEAGGQLDEDELVLVRTVGADGRSRAHVGGRTVPVGVLGELAEHLAAVHGQADQWRLRRPDQHREVLDEFAGEAATQALTAYRSTYRELSEAEAERASLTALDRERTREADVLQAALELIERIDPVPGEDAALQGEAERLGHAESLREAASVAHLLLAGEGYAAADDTGAIDALARARSALARVAAHDPTLAGLEQRAGELGYLAAELGGDLAGYLADLHADPQRLAWVQHRLDELRGLTRRYGDTIDEVLEWARESAARLADLAGAEERLAGLDARVTALRTRLESAADAVTTARAEAANRFADRVTGELAHLSMGSAQVSVELSYRADPDGLAVAGSPEPVRYGPDGVDVVEIQLAAHSGAPARSIARSASGGELARLMLAVEVVSGSVSGTSAVPTFVFDEVDAGVGGNAAVDVGARLAALGEHAQVIVVTHLAQVAAYARRHHVVRKNDDGVVTVSSVVEVEGDERVRELARMMAGSSTGAGLGHAREVLERAQARPGHGAKAGGTRPARPRR
jgi:DNA repair protein RecN (Recombination protein N)